MPVTYTNRKGQTYYLCQGMTKTGKLHYYFARQPKEGSPDHIPHGFRISESVNGVVSLVKDRPQHISPQEVALVEAVDINAWISAFVASFAILTPIPNHESQKIGRRQIGRKPEKYI